MECYGREDAPPIILTHGWGANSTEWDYLKKELSEEFRLIVWDLPGLGRSTRPTNRDYSMENLSRHLDAVLALAGDQPAILLGHSIGGMITLTFCRLFLKAMGDRVRAIALVQTTHTNPVRTTNMAGLLTALETSSSRSASPSDDLAVTADLVVQFDELPEWLCTLIDQKQRFCRHRNLGGTGFRSPLSTASLASRHGTRYVGNASLRCNFGSQRH